MRLQDAAADRLGHADFLELICQDELAVRNERLLKRRTKLADFHDLKTLEDFDWHFNPAIHRKDIFELATGAFIRKATDVFFVGPLGVGKTHLAQAIGYEAIKMNFNVLYRSIFDLVNDFLRDQAFNQQERTVRKYLKPELLIIDDMGLKSLPKHSAEYLLEVIMRAPLRKPSHHHDQQPAHRRMRKAPGRCAQRLGHPGPLPAPHPNHCDHRTQCLTAEVAPLPLTPKRRGG